MSSRQDTAEQLWLKLTSRRQQASADKVTEVRQANTTRLRQARLKKEAEEKARADLRTAKKTHQD